MDQVVKWQISINGSRFPVHCNAHILVESFALPFVVLGQVL